MKVLKVLLVFLLGANALQDLRKQEIFFLPTVLYGFLELWLFLLWEESMTGFLAGCLPGLFLLLFSLCTSGQVGMGDGWMLLVMGPVLGIFSTMLVLWLALALMTALCLVLLSVERVGSRTGKTGGRAGKDRRKMRLPMVPFLLAAAVCLLIL